MRVVCINDKWVPSPLAVNNPLPTIGDVFTVKDEVFCKKYNAYFYEFVEYPNCFYHKPMFVEIDDTPAEVIEETELQTA